MEGRKKFVLLKLEGIFFALAMIFFVVMYYFGYMTPYMLVTILLCSTAVLFSINATIQGEINSKAVERCNIIISFLIFAGGLGSAIYFYSAGLIMF